MPWLCYWLIIIIAMQRKLQEQTKTIEYLKSKYKERTGEDIVMPKSWEEYLSLEQDEAPIRPLPQTAKVQQQTLTFLTAIDQLSLPTRLSYSKVPFTSFSPANKYHMIELIDLSGFKERGFSKNSLREFLSRVVEMRCLKMVNLSRNGIGEQCAEEIQVLLGIKRITRVDLSSNAMGKTCLQIISKNFSHLEWVDLSRNAFVFEKLPLQALLNAVRVNAKLYHMQMDWQDDKMLYTFLSYLKIKPHIHSLGPVDSRITAEGMEVVAQVLETRESKKDNYRIYSLNFDFCYLQKEVFGQLTRALTGNLSLIRLVLSNNHLGEEAIIPFLAVLASNLSLIEVNLSANLLEDRFAFAFADCLRKNEILQIVDISKNNIAVQGGAELLKALGEANDTIESLGAFQTNVRMGSELIQKMRRALRINKVSKDVRSKILSEQPGLSVAEIANRQTEAFLDSEFLEYELLQPLAVTNQISHDPYRFQVWKFE